MPFETGTGGVQRVDTNDPNYNTRTVTIVAPGTQGFVAGDASRWTPWGSYLTAEESWGAGSDKGRLFEVTNPLSAGPNGGNFVQRTIVPRVSHEGLAFDRRRAMYFVDELNGGSLYKFVSERPRAEGGDDYFAQGQTFVLRVGNGGQFEGNNGPAITGQATWVPITNELGGPIPGVSTVLGDGTIDGRVTADHATILGTGFNRPEDLELQTLPCRGDDRHDRDWDDDRHGWNHDRDDDRWCGERDRYGRYRRSRPVQLLYFATTDSDVNANTTDGRSRVYTLNLSTMEVRLFASAESLDLATGLPVGGGFRNADNLAIDADGNIYIIEDRNGGDDNDIWFAVDKNKDGDILDKGEGLARWASNGTQGSEFTGLYFDTRNANRAYVNIQHPASGVDRLIEIVAKPRFPKKHDDN